MAIGPGHKNVLLSMHRLHIFYVFCLFNNTEFTFPKKFYLFNTLVGSVLNFGSEIWGHRKARKINQPIGTILWNWAISPWITILKYSVEILLQNSNSLILHTYLMFKHDTVLNRHYAWNNWAWEIKTILDSYGFSYILDHQFEIDIPFDEI
jgi:hypothetical protein